MAAKRLTKAQLFSELAEATELPKKKVSEVFDALTDLMRKQLTGRGPGEFVFPGLLKIRVVKRPATKEREGINPQTREKITILHNRGLRATAFYHNDLITDQTIRADLYAGVMVDVRLRRFINAHLHIHFRWP